ncbi:FmdB family zinc ribbon protein [Desulfacinum hydrothermale]|uniref:FmdB family zinc ribbon protein n=1 Tax=Desulfacinum hydrothermale TaxID=109258 RepID=UPI000A060643|nr:zinc ribbon domain-containing protein [Desulfacinum hydrothermale]
MPIYEYVCDRCGGVSEHLVLGDSEVPACSHCGSTALRKLLSAPSAASGVRPSDRVAGPGDTGCCGSSPDVQGCVPGSCCGKA